jgi:hypothetical protein
MQQEQLPALSPIVDYPRVIKNGYAGEVLKNIAFNYDHRILEAESLLRSITTVNSDADIQKAREALKACNALEKELEEQRKIAVAPLNETFDIIQNKIKKEMMSKLEKYSPESQRVEKLIIDYDKRKQAEIAEANRRAAEAARKAEEERQAQLKLIEEEEDPLEKALKVAELPTVSIPVTPQIASMPRPGVRKVKKFYVTDASLIPRNGAYTEFWILDEKKLAAAVISGLVPCPAGAHTKDEDEYRR